MDAGVCWRAACGTWLCLVFAGFSLLASPLSQGRDPARRNLDPPAGLKESARQKVADAIDAHYRARKAPRAERLAALQGLQAALKSHPDCHCLYYYIGEAYLGLDELAEALKPLDAGLKAVVHFHEAMALRAEALRRLHRFAEARKAFDAALAIDPNYAPALEGKARLLSSLGERKEAAALGQKMAGAGGDDPRQPLTRRLRFAAQGPGWQTPYRSETEHFLITSDISQALVDDAGGHSELVWKRCAGVLPRRARAEARVPVWIYGDTADFQRDHGRARLGGFYDRALGSVQLQHEENGEKTLSLLRHLIAHACLSEELARPPFWLDEGAAEFFASLRIAGGKSRSAQPEVNAGHYDLYVQAMDTQKLVPLVELLKLPEERAVQDKLGTLYCAQAWSVAHFLHTDGGKHQGVVKGFIAELGKGLGLEAAYKKTFGNGMTERNFESDYIKAMNRLLHERGKKPLTGEGASLTVNVVQRDCVKDW